MQLESAAPPLSVGWLSTAWWDSDPPENEVETAIAWIEAAIVRSEPHSIHYLFDVAQLAARCRLRAAGEPVEFAMPHTTGPSTITCAPPSTMCAVARLLTAPGANRNALSLYVFYCALAANRAITWTPALADAPPAHFAKCVRAYGADCKFKRHGDLYLWSLVRLKIPAWLGASYPGHIAPWAAFAACYQDDANDVGRGMIGTPADELLDTVLVQVELYVIIVGILLELTSAPGTILINTALLTATSTLPTPYASSDFATVEAMFGYTHKGVVYCYEEPWAAALAWLKALDAAVEGLVSVRQMVAFASAAIPPPSNPLCKFLGK
jgi:hypothetical protein